MLYRIERRYARRQGVLLRWYEVRSYTHRTADGTLKGGKTIKDAKTKKEAAAFCRRHRIEITEERDDMENITEEMAIRQRYELVKAATRKTAGRKQDFARWLRRLAGKYLIILLSFVLYSVLLLRGQQAKDLRLYEAERAQLVATHAVELEAKDREIALVRQQAESGIYATQYLDDEYLWDAWQLALWLDCLDDTYPGITVEAKGLACWCIFNRIESSEYPESVEGVLLQPGQFCEFSNSYSDSDRPTEGNIAVAKNQLSRWKNGDVRPAPSRAVFMSVSSEGVVLRDTFTESNKTGYWRA